MERYAEKVKFLVEYYNWKCPCKCPECDALKKTLSKPDLHHKLGKARAGKTAQRQMERHGRFIDSLANLIPVPHNCHIMRHSSLPRFNEAEADRMEAMMSDSFGAKTFGEILNMECDSTWDETSEALDCFLELGK